MKVTFVTRSCALVAVLLIAMSASSAGSRSKSKVPDLPRDPKTGIITYQDVVEVEDVDALELQGRAAAWAARSYRSSNDAVQLDDRDGARIIIKGIFVVPWYMISTSHVQYTLTFEFKDGRYRYTVSDFRFVEGAWDSPLDERPKGLMGYNKVMRGVDSETRSLIASFVEAIAAGGDTGGDDW